MKRKCLLFLCNEVLVDLETFWANPLAFKSINLRDLLDGFAGRMRIVLREIHRGALFSRKSVQYLLPAFDRCLNFLVGYRAFSISVG